MMTFEIQSRVNRGSDQKQAKFQTFDFTEVMPTDSEQRAVEVTGFLIPWIYVQHWSAGTAAQSFHVIVKILKAGGAREKLPSPGSKHLRAHYKTQASTVLIRRSKSNAIA